MTLEELRAKFREGVFPESRKVKSWRGLKQAIQEGRIQIPKPDFVFLEPGENARIDEHGNLFVYKIRAKYTPTKTTDTLRSSFRVHVY